MYIKMCGGLHYFINNNIITLDQETINKHLRDIFGIKTGYHGSVVSSFAKVGYIS